MGSLLLREEWPGQRDGCLHPLFAQRGAAVGLEHSFGPVCILNTPDPAKVVALALSKQLAKELISLASS